MKFGEIMLAPLKDAGARNGKMAASSANLVLAIIRHKGTPCDDGTFEIKQADIQQLARCCYSTLYCAMKALKANGYIVEVLGGEGQKPNRYRLHEMFMGE